jgi:hypothetical protein
MVGYCQGRTLKRKSSSHYCRLSHVPFCRSNSLAAWAQEWLIIGEADTKTYIGVAKPLEWQQGFENEDTLLYPNYCGYIKWANFKEVSLTRFSALLEDLCRDQLRLEHVGKCRDKDGVYLTGIRLRTPRDRNISGFIDMTITPSDTVQDPEDSMKGSRPENADYVDLFTNEFPEEPSHTSEFPKKPTYPTYSTLSGARAYINPTSPYTARPGTTKKVSNPYQERSEWPYGKL